MTEDRGYGIDRETLYNRWSELTEWQRDIFFLLFWVEMQKRNRLFWLFIIVALAALITWGISSDPLVLVAGFAVGLILGILFFALR